MKSSLSVLLLIFLPFLSFAQNTLEGKLAVVPEEEVKRQSAFIDAERERLLEHWDKAEAQLRDFLRENPEHSAAWYSLARVQSALENNGAALESVNKAIKLDPGNPWYPIFQADLLEKNGQSAAAAAVYEDLVKKYPDNPGYLRQLAYLYTLSGEPKGALKTLDKLEKKTGLSPEIAEKKHLLYIGMDQPEKAAAELRRLIEAYPNRLAYRRQLANYYREINREADARKVYAEILQIDPNDPAARMALGGAMANSKDDNLLRNPQIPIDSKLKELIPQLEKYGRQPDIESLTRLEQAADALEQAHPDDPRSWSFSGDVYYLSNQPEKAIEKYTRCLQFSNTPYSVWENTMRILYEQGRNNEVMQTAERAMEAWPNRPESYLLYGLAAIRAGKASEAVPVLQQARLMTAKSDDAALKQQIQEALETAQKKN